MPPYPYLATDYGTQLSLFTHHMWIGGFLIVGAAAHAAIFMVRDYDPTIRYNDLLDRDNLVSVGGKVALLPIPLGTADFLVHHIHAFTIHVTVLILLKGVLFARSSRLIPDKANLGFRFPCDGPGRGSYGSSLSAYGLFFLGAHFIWAFSLMFLFSGRGYWQELIESIVWAHNKLKVAPATQPRALSIVQGRAVGVTHYLLGGIATTWAFFLARIIAVG
nr:Photosystem I P700 chlorophyll a apoprotein A1 family [Cajanus cajan]